MGPEQQYGYQPQQRYTQPQDPATRRRKIILIVIGVFAVLTVIVIVLSSLLAPPNIRLDLVKIAAQQNEIARVAALGASSEDARTSTQNLASTVKSVSLSNFISIDTWADKKLSAGISDSEATSAENENTDNALTEAGASNKYGDVFTEAVELLLEEANNQIAASFSTFSAYPDLQAILNETGENNKLLLEAVANQ